MDAMLALASISLVFTYIWVTTGRNSQKVLYHPPKSDILMTALYIDLYGVSDTQALTLENIPQAQGSWQS